MQVGIIVSDLSNNILMDIVLQVRLQHTVLCGTGGGCTGSCDHTCVGDFIWKFTVLKCVLGSLYKCMYLNKIDITVME